MRRGAGGQEALGQDLEALPVIGDRPGQRHLPGDQGRLLVAEGRDGLAPAGCELLPEQSQAIITILDNDRITLEPLRFSLFSGTYDGALRATVGDALDVRLTSTVAKIDVAQLAAFGGVPDTITGLLTGNATVAGRGTDLAAVLRSARGTGSASIADGTIKRLNLIRTVVLFFGRPEPDAAPGAGAFDQIQAKFSLAEGVVSAQEFTMRSPDADIDGQGSLSLASKSLDGGAELRLSEALSKQAGTDLVRFTREGNRVLLPARISGTLAAPRITIDAAAAARRGLRNEAERRLRDLFKR